MKKSELVEALAAQAGISKAESGRIIAALKQVADIEISNGRTFEISGIINLSVQTRAARKGRNPATGEALDIPAKRVVKARVPHSLTSLAG